MIKVRFLSSDGESEHEAEAAGGTRLLDLAQASGQPLEGTCEGQMACSTCHVIIAAEDWPKLPQAGEEEEDMLDLAAGVTRHSRLACQIRLDESWVSLAVRIPSAARNMLGR